MITVTIPMRTVSESNSRDHWARKAARVAQQRAIVRFTIGGLVRMLKASLMPATARLTRISPRELDDDNLRGCLKACRDSVATELGTDDRNPAIAWEYGQEKGAPAVRIEIRPRKDVAAIEPPDTGAIMKKATKKPAKSPKRSVKSAKAAPAKVATKTKRKAKRRA